MLKMTVLNITPITNNNHSSSSTNSVSFLLQQDSLELPNVDWLSPAAGDPEAWKSGSEVA